MPKPKKKTFKRKNSKKGSRQVFAVPEAENALHVPKTFIFKSGQVTPEMKQLVLNMRKVMSPYTAINLKIKKSNTMDDILGVTGPLGISHLLIFSQTERSTHLRLVRLPHGPTLTFKIIKFCLQKDVMHSLKNPYTLSTLDLATPPLVVLNNFPSDQNKMKLATIMVQSLFPALNIETIKLHECKRVVLFSYDKETDLIEMRHFVIRVISKELSRPIKRLLNIKKTQQFPKLGEMEDIGEFFDKQISESEASDGEYNLVTLPKNLEKPKKSKLFRMGSVVSSTRQSAIRLIETGPRLTLQLCKIEDAVCSGEVIFHLYYKKTEKEKQETRLRHKHKKEDKEMRKKVQEQNVLRKQKAKEKLDQKGTPKDPSKEDTVVDDADDDAEYYRQEVGEEPDPELFRKTSRSSKKLSLDPWWKKRTQNNLKETKSKEKSKPKTSKSRFSPSQNKPQGKFGKKRPASRSLSSSTNKRPKTR